MSENEIMTQSYTEKKGYCNVKNRKLEIEKIILNLGKIEKQIFSPFIKKKVDNKIFENNQTKSEDFFIYFYIN